MKICVTIMLMTVLALGCGTSDTSEEAHDDPVEFEEEQAVADGRLVEKRERLIRRTAQVRLPLGAGPLTSALPPVGKQPKMIEGPFLAPESCAKGPDGNWYFGSIAPSTASYDETDFLGWIARYDPQGQNLPNENYSMDSIWLYGMHGVEGMAWIGQDLYVADVDGINRIRHVAGVGGVLQDIIAIPGRGNDVVAGPNGELYVSDPPNNRLYKITTPSTAPVVTTWLSTPALQIPNGLLVDAGYLYVATLGVYSKAPPLGSLLRISLATKAITVIKPSFVKGDGLAKGLGSTLIITDIVTSDVHRINKSTGIIESTQNWPGGPADIATDGVTVCVPKLNSNAGGLISIIP